MDIVVHGNKYIEKCYHLLEELERLREHPENKEYIQLYNKLEEAIQVGMVQ